MNRLAPQVFAFSFIFAALVVVMYESPVAEASPSPVLPARSIDVTTTQRDCHATFLSAHEDGGATLSAIAMTSDRSIAVITGGLGILDAPTPVAVETQVSWSHGCTA